MFIRGNKRSNNLDAERTKQFYWIGYSLFLDEAVVERRAIDRWQRDVIRGVIAGTELEIRNLPWFAALVSELDVWIRREVADVFIVCE